MLKKRIIGVITVLDGWAVQSFGYERYLPLGKPKVLAKNLNDWGADEIFIQCINRSKDNLGPDMELLESIGSLCLSTPLIYGGGIRNVNHAKNAIKAGCERISVDSLIHDDIKTLKNISQKLGSQSLIAAVPVLIKGNNIYWLDYKKNLNKRDFDSLINITNQNLISEILLIDAVNEGGKNSFNKNILNYFPIKNKKLILFGGITDINQMRTFFNEDNISSVAIGNFLSYKEHSIQLIKKDLNLSKIRSPFFKDSFN